MKTDTGITCSSEDRAKAVLVIERDGDALNDRALICDPGQPIAGKIDADFMAGSGQCPRQGADHVCQTAGL